MRHCTRSTHSVHCARLSTASYFAGSASSFCTAISSALMPSIASACSGSTRIIMYYTRVLWISACTANQSAPMPSVLPPPVIRHDKGTHILNISDLLSYNTAKKGTAEGSSACNASALMPSIACACAGNAEGTPRMQSACIC